MLAALRPSGLRERLRLAIGGGYTALQVWERLEPAVRAALVDPRGEDATVTGRRAVERVQRVLMALAATGRVRHARVGMSITLNTKGPRDVLVDVFRAT
ncbi:MAG: hypothetical protein Q8P18_24870 [Pseudomonadota bacterium]|nr:hypothetical protein [Pseudomonadota bacterium]